MIPLIGKLHRENNVVITLYAKPLINRSVIDILKAHQYVRHVENNELSVRDTFPILEALTELDLGYAHVDLGKMALKYQAVGAGMSVAEFVEAEVKEVIGNKNPILPQPQDVVLYGFGRIGRLLARLLIEKTGGGETLRLRAIVVRASQMDDLAKRASLLIRDSIHGPFQGTV
ncbi:MAG TPA: glyceraldehyde-3-phosphate dehydrogenase, partial [Gammaproteobacteria bacterium]|nr:glyceraldehyde-3-phosphate dehydrogenase [Gammaproteobacteria bacterium]